MSFKKIVWAGITLLAMGGIARGENIFPHEGCIVTNMAFQVSPQEWLDWRVPTIIISGPETRLEVTDPEQFRYTEVDDNGEVKTKYYSIYLRDGACLTIKDGAYMKCNILRVGEIPFRGSPTGNDTPNLRSPIIVFERDVNSFVPPDFLFFSNAIFTGCGDDNTADAPPTDFLYLLNGIIKIYQSTYHAQFTFIAPSRDVWMDGESYDSEILCHGTSMFPFWDLDNIRFDLSRHWKLVDLIRPAIQAQSNCDDLSGLMWQNNENIGPYLTMYWTGGSSIFPEYVQNINNFKDYQGRDLNARDPLAQSKMLFPPNTSPNKVLTWDQAGSFNSAGAWSSSYVNYNRFLTPALEVRDNYTFTKHTIIDNYNEQLVHTGAMDFLGSWIIGGDYVTNTVSFEQLRLVGDSNILVGRMTGTEGQLLTTYKSFEDTAFVLNCELVGGNHMPILRKCDNGSLIVACNTPAYTGVVEVCEGTFTLKDNVHFACWDLRITPNSMERNIEARYADYARPVHLTLNASKGSILETRTLTGCYQHEYYTSFDLPSRGVASVPFGSCTVAFTNATLRLTGHGGIMRVDAPTPEDASMLKGKLHLDIGSELADSTPAMTVDIPNPSASYTLDIPTRGSGTLRKQGPGTLKFLSTPSQAVTVECTEGIVDFNNAYIHNRLGGTGTLRNCQYDLVIQDPVADSFSSLVLGEGCVAKSLTIDFRNRDWSDCIAKKFPIATCATPALLRELHNQLTQLVASSYSLLFEPTFPFKAPELQLFVDESSCKLFGRIVARGAGSLLLIN